MDELTLTASRVAARLRERCMRLATAESCTGGWIAKVLTDLAGSSDWFERGVVTYSNRSKHELVGVREATLERHGAVSEASVREMAAGLLARSGADITLAVSGIAGPGGGTPDKPVGTVWFAWDGPRRTTRRIRFDGDREAVRRQAVLAALEGVLVALDDT